MLHRIVINCFAAASLFAQNVDYVADVKNKPAYDSREYKFTRTNTKGASGDLSVAGTNRVVTLTPCPKGINGTNTNHYVYVSGGTGTAEASLITGGTCTSGAASGTITINTSNTHTGSWSITSASGGIQETAWGLPTTGGVILLPTAATLYQTVTMGNGTSGGVSTRSNIFLTGHGASASLSESNIVAGTRLDWAGPNGGIMLQWNGPLTGGGIENALVSCQGTAATAIKTNHVFGAGSRFKHLSIIGCTSFAVIEDAYPNSGFVTGANALWEDIRIHESGLGGAAASGFKLGPTGGVPNPVQVSRSDYRKLEVLCQFAGSTGTAFELNGVDAVQFSGITSLYCQKSIYLNAPVGTPYYPTNIVFNRSVQNVTPTWSGGWIGEGIIFNDYLQERDGSNIPQPSIPIKNGISGKTNFGTLFGIEPIGIFNVKAFGASGDGTTDDTAAINAAIAAVPANGGTVYFPSGNYKITSTITIGNGSSGVNSTVNNIQLKGAGGFYLDDFGTGTVASSKLTWAGGTGTTMINVAGPISGVGIFDLVLVGGGTSTLSGITAYHPMRSTFERIGIYQTTDIGFLLTTYPAMTTGVNLGAGVNTFKQIHLAMSGTSSYGLVVGPSTFGAGVFDAARNYFYDIEILGPANSGGNGVLVRFADSNIFEKVSIQGWGPTGSNVQWKWGSVTGNHNFPTGNVVQNSFINTFGTDAWSVTAAVSVDANNTCLTAAGSGFTLAGEYAYLYGFTGNWKRLNGFHIITTPNYTGDADKFCVNYDATDGTYTGAIGPAGVKPSNWANNIFNVTREDADPSTNGTWLDHSGTRGWDAYGMMHNWTRIGINKSPDKDYLIDAIPDQLTDLLGATSDGKIRINSHKGNTVLNLTNEASTDVTWTVTNTRSTGDLDLAKDASSRGRFPSAGGIQLFTGTRPSCDSTARGTLFYVAGGVGVLDTLEICRKDASNNYAWVSLF